MSRASENRIVELARKKGLLRAKDLSAEELPREYLSRMSAIGILQRVGRGLYALPNSETTQFHSLAEVSAAVPHGVICLLSALRFHGLGTQLPPDVWVAVSGPVWRPTKPPFPVRYVHMTGNSFLRGVESHVVDKVKIRVFSRAKTVADCFKYRNKIGLDVALEALRDYLDKTRGGADELWRYAKVCRVTRILQPYLDSIR